MNTDFVTVTQVYPTHLLCANREIQIPDTPFQRLLKLMKACQIARFAVDAHSLTDMKTFPDEVRLIDANNNPYMSITWTDVVAWFLETIGYTHPSEYYTEGIDRDRAYITSMVGDLFVVRAQIRTYLTVKRTYLDEEIKSEMAWMAGVRASHPEVSMYYERAHTREMIDLIQRRLLTLELEPLVDRM